MAETLTDAFLEEIKSAPVPELKTIQVDGYTVSYREVVPISPHYDVLFLHGMRFKSETWACDPLWTLQMMHKLNFRAVALALPGYEQSSNISIDTHVYLGDVISALKLDKPVIVSPSMSGNYSVPYLFNEPKTTLSRARGYIPVAPINTGGHIEQYKQSQIPTLIIMGENDVQIGTKSLTDLSNLPNKTVVQLAGAGHACYMDKPKEFHQHFVAFLQSLVTS